MNKTRSNKQIAESKWGSYNDRYEFAVFKLYTQLARKEISQEEFDYRLDELELDLKYAKSKIFNPKYTMVNGKTIKLNKERWD